MKEEGDQKVIVIQDFDENHEQRYRMLSNYPVIPSTAILDIENFLSFALETYQLQEKTVGQIEEDDLESMGTYDIHALIYNDFPLELEEVKDHVYSMIRKDKIENLEELKKITNMFSCKEKDQAVFTSKEILKGKCSLMNNTSLLFLEKQKQEWLKKYGLDSKSILSFRAKIKQATKEVQESLGEELLKLISKKSFQDDYEKALELIYRGANIEFKNEKKGDFPLLICARKNYVKTFFALIKAGANVNQTNNYLTTATMASARQCFQMLVMLRLT